MQNDGSSGLPAGTANMTAPARSGSRPGPGSARRTCPRLARGSIPPPGIDVEGGSLLQPLQYAWRRYTTSASIVVPSWVRSAAGAGLLQAAAEAACRITHASHSDWIISVPPGTAMACRGCHLSAGLHESEHSPVGASPRPERDSGCHANQTAQCRALLQINGGCADVENFPLVALLKQLQVQSMPPPSSIRMMVQQADGSKRLEPVWRRSGIAAGDSTTRVPK